MKLIYEHNENKSDDVLTILGNLEEFKKKKKKENVVLAFKNNLIAQNKRDEKSEKKLIKTNNE